MHSKASLRRKKIACCVTAFADLVLLLSLLVFLGFFYYMDVGSSFMWKCGLTLNSFVLLFEIRLRLCCFVGYPLKDMEAIGSPVVLTSIRMKLADYLGFFYIFFCQVIYACVLIMKRYATQREHTMFLIIVSMNTVFLVFWILCTNSRTFSRFPKEKARLGASSHESDLSEDMRDSLDQQGLRDYINHSRVEREPRPSLSANQVSLLVRSMRLYQDDEADRSLEEEQACAICLESLQTAMNSRRKHA